MISRTADDGQRRPRVPGAQPAAAIPYLDKLVTDFEVSEYLEPARTQLAELKAQMQAQIKKN